MTAFALRRWILGLAGLFILVYAFVVLLYVQFVPDLGLRTIFATDLLSRPGAFDSGNTEFEPRDQIRQIGPIGPLARHEWSNVLKAPRQIRAMLEGNLDWNAPPEWLQARRWSRDNWIPIPWKEFDDSDPDQAYWVRLEMVRDDLTYTAWCKLGHLPVREILPSLLWLLLKASLLLIGAWVWWKKPHEPAAEVFYLLCLVTMGAFIGGYHWAHIAVQPILLLVFMTCAVLLPAVSLHFYLLFPRPKLLLQWAPRGTLAFVYGIPLAFLAAMLALYFRLRWLNTTGPEQDSVQYFWRQLIFTYLGVASTWYLGSVVALVHSYVSVSDPTARNQVRSILLGALLASLPMGYSLYLIFADPSAFSAGAATWPMFSASAIFTLAFAVSITRYRLMEFEGLLSTSMDYFVASFLAAALYYAIVFLGTLLFNRYVASPQLSTAVAVSATVLLLFIVLDQARWKVRKFLDRRFTKEKSQLDLTLQRMGQAIEQLVDPPILAQRFLQATTEVLGVANGSVFLRQGDPPVYRLAGCQGSPPPLGELPPGSPLVDTLQTGAVVLAQIMPYQPLNAAQRQLRNLGGQFAHPVMHEDRMLAFVILGPKDRPYRTEDADLLGAFAQITALALESAAGHRTIEQLNSELRDKVQKISEQQRRIMALQTQLHRQKIERPPASPPDDAEATHSEPPAPPLPAGIIGSSDAVQSLLGLVRKVSGTDAAVLIRGESGTGKELLARAVHETSARAAKAFVKVHCAALSANLLESELFGHVKGAFTGAHKDKVGRFELADGGTLFLDEIGDISLEVQTKLLRVLQERTFERVGSSEPIQVDVRIITATHQNLENLIRQGRFREDLFYRLNVFPVVVPPLRERTLDITELAMHFMKQAAQRCKKELITIEDDALVVLKSHPWPGNIRQLENVIERAVVIAEGNAITLQELPAEMLTEPPEETTAEFPQGQTEDNNVTRPLSPMRRERLRQEREELVRALASAAGNKAEAARALGMARSTFVSRLKKFGLV